MIPPLIVEAAVKHNISLIAITDHNASDNIAAVMQAAKGYDLTVLPGMELQTREDVHCLCLFDTIDQIQAFQNLVDQSLPEIKNNANFFGEQFVVDHSGVFIRRKDQLLITSTRFSLEEAFHTVTDIGGLFIPAHVNRQSFSLFYHLGFVPPDLPIEALEVSRHTTPEGAAKDYPQIKGYPLIQSGDVHLIDEFLGANNFLLENPSISEIKMALRGENGRKITIKPIFDDSLC